MLVASVDSTATILHVVRDLAGTGTVTGSASSLSYSYRDVAGNVTTSGFSATEQGSSGYYDVPVAVGSTTGNAVMSITNPSGSDEGTYDYPIQIVQSAAGITPGGTFLTTLANVKETLDVSHSDWDDFLTNLIARASQRIEREVGRPLVSASYDEYCDGEGHAFLYLRRGPIVSVTGVYTVTYDSSGNETTATVSAGNYFARNKASEGSYDFGYLEHYSGGWVRGQRNYLVSYSAGFASVPYDLEQACISLVVAYFNKRKGWGTNSRDLGSGSVDYTSDFVVSRDLRDTLEPYMDYRV